MDADGRGVRQLTRNTATPDTPAGDFSPAWSPDGRHIAFVSDRDGSEAEIYRMRADGTRQTRLTQTDPTVSDYSPAWSPDGRHILFGSTRAGFFNAEVYRMRADGTQVRRLTETPDGVDDDGAEYAPDGRTIVFSSNREGDRDLYTMRTDGRDVRRLTGVPAFDEWFPAWTPDGRHVVYWSFSLEGTSPDTAWIVERDGDDPRRLTEGGANDTFPNVRPERRR
jgi:TolB protein